MLYTPGEMLEGEDELTALGYHVHPFLGNNDTVSYTHLDVYKRQLLIMTAPLNLDMCKWHVPWPMNMTENTRKRKNRKEAANHDAAL